jgi:DNA polymerase (family 10)
LAEVIQPADITSIIHSHSNWSDGVHTLEQMANHAKNQGLQYLVISDHSKTAFYANGLSEERIRAQHQQVDELNASLPLQDLQKHRKRYTERWQPGL